MIKLDARCRVFILQIIMLFTLAACDNSGGDIPFPEQYKGFSQPETRPLRFASEKKLNWTTIRSGGIKSVVRKFDIDKLPSKASDSAYFIPFVAPPVETHFTWSALRDTVFDLNMLKSLPLKFVTSLLPPYPMKKQAAPIAKAGTSISLFELGAQQGLPGKMVTSVLKDRSGLVWVATTEGLFRCNGEFVQIILSGLNFRYITGLTEDNKGNIWFVVQGSLGMINPGSGIVKYSSERGSRNNGISKMMKDDKGRIWVSYLQNQGVVVIDPEAQTFKQIDKSTGLAGYSWDILEDSSKNIWVTTVDHGAAIFNIEEGKIRFLKRTDGLGSDSLGAMTMDKEGQVWMGSTAAGLDAVDINRGTIKHYGKMQGISDMFTSSMLSIKNDRIWVGRVFEVIILDPRQGALKHLNQNEEISRDAIFSSMEDNENVWLATQTGLKIVGQNGEMVHPSDNSPVSTILEASGGNIWVGTIDGIRIINPKKRVMQYLRKQQGISSNWIQSFLESNGEIWISSNGGFDIINTAQKTIEHTGKKEGLASDTVYSILLDDRKNLWLTGPSAGIGVIDAKKTSIKQAGVAGGLSDDAILDVKQDEDGLVWLATRNKGVDIIERDKGIVRNLIDAPGLKDTSIRILLPDEKGRMWIGTDKGIYVADTKAKTLTSISEAQGLPFNAVTSLHAYKGCILAAANNKVSIITPPGSPNLLTGAINKQWLIEPLANSEGLTREFPNNWSTNIITSKGEYLWGDKGVTIINGVRANNANFPTWITGMQLLNQNDRQVFLNNYQFETNDTLWSRDTFYLKGQTLPDAEKARQNGISWDGVSEPYNMPVNLHIPYNRNYIQFQYSQANFGRPDTTFYCYILLGIDKQWSSPTSNTFTENYLNLTPGSYTFKVRSKEPDGRWSEPAVFRFTITPPWWKTIWAYIIYLVLFLMLFRAFTAYRSRNLQRQNKLLEEKIELRTRALNESLSELKATQAQLIQSEKMASLGELTAGIAHEIQNPLNFVNNFSEVNTELVDELQAELRAGNIEDALFISDDIKANEQKINHHGKRADAIVKGMLQHSRASTGKRELTNINALADEYLRLSYHGLRARDKAFNATMIMDFDDNAGKINVMMQDMGRVLLNLFTNAFYSVTEKKKQKGENYEPTVWVTTKRRETGAGSSEILITVKDNGNGIPKNVLDKIFQPFFTTKPTGQGTGLGLSLSYDIIKAHGGELQVETEEGEGAQFIILLPVAE